jgi:hypothetical protein
MKKTYEKPTLEMRGRLSDLTAVNGSSAPVS